MNTNTASRHRIPLRNDKTIYSTYSPTHTGLENHVKYKTRHTNGIIIPTSTAEEPYTSKNGMSWMPSQQPPPQTEHNPPPITDPPPQTETRYEANTSTIKDYVLRTLLTALENSGVLYVIRNQNTDEWTPAPLPKYPPIEYTTNDILRQLSPSIHSFAYMWDRRLTSLTMDKERTVHTTLVEVQKMLRGMLQELTQRSSNAQRQNYTTIHAELQELYTTNTPPPHLRERALCQMLEQNLDGDSDLAYMLLHELRSPTSPGPGLLKTNHAFRDAITDRLRINTPWTQEVLGTIPWLRSHMCVWYSLTGPQVDSIPNWMWSYMREEIARSTPSLNMEHPTVKHLLHEDTYLHQMQIFHTHIADMLREKIQSNTDMTKTAAALEHMLTICTRARLVPTRDRTREMTFMCPYTQTSMLRFFWNEMSRHREYNPLWHNHAYNKLRQVAKEGLHSLKDNESDRDTKWAVYIEESTIAGYTNLDSMHDTMMIVFVLWGTLLYCLTNTNPPQTHTTPIIYDAESHDKMTEQHEQELIKLKEAHTKMTEQHEQALVAANLLQRQSDEELQRLNITYATLNEANTKMNEDHKQEMAKVKQRPNQLLHHVNPIDDRAVDTSNSNTTGLMHRLTQMEEKHKLTEEKQKQTEEKHKQELRNCAEENAKLRGKVIEYRESITKFTAANKQLMAISRDLLQEKVTNMNTKQNIAHHHTLELNKDNTITKEEHAHTQEILKQYNTNESPSILDNVDQQPFSPCEVKCAIELDRLLRNEEQNLCDLTSELRKSVTDNKLENKQNHAEC